MPVRDADKLRSKMTLSLDRHQVGYMTFGGLVLAGLVFASGFAVGQRMAPERSAAPAAEAACLEVLDDPAPSALPAAPALHFESRLMSPSSPALPDDPTLHLLAENRTDLAVPGITPPPPAEPPAAALVAPVPPVPPPPAAVASAPTPPPAAVVAPPAKPIEKPAAEPVAKPAAKPAAKPTATAAPQKPGKATYTLQVQAFRQKNEAEAFAATLRSRGHKPYVEESNVAGRGRWFRVRVGRFPDHKDALAFQERFEKEEGIDTFVMPLR